MKNFIKTQKIHRDFGAKEIDPNIILIEKSKNKHKKYKVQLEDGTNIHFGDVRYQHYYDRFGKFFKLDHKDKERRINYLSRASAIRNKENKLTINDPYSANFYAIRILW
jgi:hypothetical protein